MSVQTTAVRAARTFNQIVGLVAGAAFIAVGTLGFTVTGPHHAVGTEGGQLLGLFQVNVLHNVVHLAVGAALIAASIAGARLSRLVNAAVGVVYLLVGVLGIFIVSTDANIIALNTWDNGLHLFSGIALLGVGTMADRD